MRTLPAINQVLKSFNLADSTERRAERTSDKRVLLTQAGTQLAIFFKVFIDIFKRIKRYRVITVAVF